MKKEGKMNSKISNKLALISLILSIIGFVSLVVLSYIHSSHILTSLRTILDFIFIVPPIIPILGLLISIRCIYYYNQITSKEKVYSIIALIISIINILVILRYYFFNYLF